MSWPWDGPSSRKRADESPRLEPQLPDSPPPAAPRPPGSRVTAPSRRVEPETDWLTAVLLGIRDTAKAMLEAGRTGAHDAYDEGWERFEAKTKHRRREDD